METHVPQLFLNRLTTLQNKKVLLRERKRHTAHRVASARYAALSHGWGGGTPHHPDLVWGGPWVPPPSKLRLGTPPPRPEMGYRPTQT